MKPHPNRPSRRLAALLLIALALALSACGSKNKPAAAQPTDQSDAIASAVAATVTAAQASGAAPAGGGEAPAVVKAGGQNDAGSGKDAGDTAETALEIKSNTDASYTGAFSEGDPADYYKLNIPAGSVVTIEFQHTGNGGLIYPTLFYDGVNYGGAQIGAGEKWNPTWLLNNSEGGNYILEVKGGPPYKFRILTKPQQDAGIEGDAGDTTETAREITPNPSAPYQGQLGNNDKADFYKIKLPAGSTVAIQFQHTGKGGLLYPTLFRDGVNYGGAQIGAGEKWNPIWVLNNSDGGDYVFSVGGSEPYTFNIISTPQQDAGAEGDAGDESSAARVVQINPAQPYKGQLGNNDKSDFYRFTLPASAKLKITARVDEKSPGMIDIALFKADTAFGSVGFIKYGSPGTLSSDKALEAGDYVLRVNGEAIYDFVIITENP